jgi:uncharacterized membrane protein (DUF441 family)
MMSQVAFILLIIAILSLFCKDYLLTSATLVLFCLHVMNFKSAIATLQKHSLQLGLFFLMLFLLLPLTDEKLNLFSLSQGLFTPIGILAIFSGAMMSYMAARGVSLCSTQPVVLIAVIIGTLGAVLLFRGLPAGLIVAAGLVSLLQKIIS